MLKRERWIDYSKGIGILLVVYGHVLQGVQKAQFDVSQTFFNLSDNFIYHFHMPLFFFLSGLFALNWAKKDFKQAFINKFGIILYPYLLWSLIQGCMRVYVADYTNTKIGWSDLLNRILFNPIDQFWFLYVLFLCFILFYLFKKVFSIEKVFIFSIFFALISILIKENIPFLLTKFFIFFVLGAFFYKKTQNNVFSNNFKLITKNNKLIISTFLILYLLESIFNINNYILNIIIAILGIFSVIFLALFIENKKLIWFEYIGLFSMQIYLMHTIASSGFRIIVQHIFYVENIFIHIIIGIIIGIIIPIIMYEVSKKLKIQKILFGR